MAVNMADLEAKIGYPPRERNEGVILRNVVQHPDKRPLLISWLILNGIPTKAANAAVPNSLANAYAISAYLAKWRKNTNPGFAAMYNGDENSGEDFDAFADEKPVAAASIPADAAERLASSVAPLIKKLVSGEVESQLAVRKLELSEAAKQKIKDIAKESGETQSELAWLNVKDWVKNELDKRIPPQEIIVRNAVSGNAVNIGVQHKQFANLLRACQMRNHQGFAPNIWLTGETGSGKTTGAENVAKALGLDFHADSSLDADYKVYGFYNAQGAYMTTGFRKIFEHGGIYVADEIDNWNQGALVALNAPLSNGWASFPDGMVARHKNCIVIACANTWGLGATSDYVGRNKLDAATRDRFHPKLEWDTDEKLEMAIANKMDPEVGGVWCELIQKTRQTVRRQGLKIIVSQRSTINGISMIQAGFEVDEAIAQTYMAGLSQEQIAVIRDTDMVYKVKRAVAVAQEPDETDDEPDFGAFVDGAKFEDVEDMEDVEA